MNKIDDRLIRELRALLPEYLAQKQIKVGTAKSARAIHCLNPAHPDRHPSMRYDFSREMLHCFSCGVNYDLFGVIALDYPNCDNFPAQVRKACEIFGREFPESGWDVASIPAREPYRGALIEAEAPDYLQMVEEGIAANGTGGAYFAGRGISAAVCERHRLYEAEGRAVLPIFAGGRCVSYCARAIDGTLQPRYKNSAGAMELFGADYFAGEGSGGALFVTEAIFDALSVEECGFQAIALCGAGNVSKLLRLCAENPAAANGYTFIAAGDNDAAGAAMNTALCEGLAALGLGCAALAMPQEGGKDLNELLLRDREGLRNVLEGAVNADRRAYAQTSAACALSELLELSARRGSRDAISTGFAGLDKVLDGGLYAGLYIIGAISSLGKTSYLLQIADYIAAHKTDVLFFSLEMSKIELMAKSVSRISRVLSDGKSALTAREVLRSDPKMTKERRALLEKSVESYRRGAGGLFLREGIAEIGAREIREAVREHIRLRGIKPVVMVDYLQILKADDPRASDKQNTDRGVVELKRISRDFDLPVVAISSFNRENYRNSVSMEAFKESGAVEYSSDVLIGLQLAGAGESGFDVNAAKGRSPRAVELVLLKNRSGAPWAKVGYRYEARCGYFAE